MPVKIEAHERPIVRIFCDEYNFLVPSYQRPYIWTTEESAQLLGDLNEWVEREKESFAENGSSISVNNLNPYFLGSVVLFRQEGRDTPANIIDGQQRLITLSLLFAAAREKLPTERKDSMTRRLKEVSDDLAGTQERFRLLPRKQDQDFYKHCILRDAGIDTEADPASDSQRNMLANAKYFLKELPDDNFLRFLAALQQKCYLVVVTTPDFNSAFRIFSVLNDRGIDLAPTDILKASIIEKIREDARDEYAKRWEEVEDYLGRDDFLKLFGYIRMIHMRAKISENLVDEMRRVVLREFQPLENFIKDEIDPYAKILSTLRNADYAASTGAEEVNRVIRHLSLIANADWLPPAMLFFRKHENKAEALKQFLGDLERLAMSMMIRRKDVNARIRRYAELLRCIDGGNDLFAENSPLQLSRMEKNETIEALNGDVYSHAKQWGAAVLRRLNYLLDEDKDKPYPSKVTIEHVLPQNPAANSEWMRSFHDSEMREEWMNRLANLVLLSCRKNSRAQNFDFEKKKSKYFNDPVTTFAITVKVIQENDWTLAVLERRQKELLDILATEWRLK